MINLVVDRNTREGSAKALKRGREQKWCKISEPANSQLLASRIFAALAFQLCSLLQNRLRTRSKAASLRCENHRSATTTQKQGFAQLCLNPCECGGQRRLADMHCRCRC